MQVAGGLNSSPIVRLCQQYLISATGAKKGEPGEGGKEDRMKLLTFISTRISLLSA